MRAPELRHRATEPQSRDLFFLTRPRSLAFESALPLAHPLEFLLCRSVALMRIYDQGALERFARRGIRARSRAVTEPEPAEAATPYGAARSLPSVSRFEPSTAI